MPRATWPLSRGRPIIEATLALAQGGQVVVRRLIADTGAGSSRSGIDILLDEQDCLLCGGTPMKSVILSGAYVGSFPTYALRLAIPHLGVNQTVLAVGLPAPPSTFDSIACFRFLNRFTYGDFGSPGEFSLEIQEGPNETPAQRLQTTHQRVVSQGRTPIRLVRMVNQMVC
jgi:hypothetical protein